MTQLCSASFPLSHIENVHEIQLYLEVWNISFTIYMLLVCQWNYNLFTSLFKINFADQLENSSMNAIL